MISMHWGGEKTETLRDYDPIELFRQRSVKQNHGMMQGCAGKNYFASVTISQNPAFGLG